MCVPNFVWIGLFCRPLAAKTPISADFWTSAFSVSTVGGSLRKLNISAQLQTFPYPTASKSFLYSKAFMAKSGAESLTFKRLPNKQTNRQTNKQKTQRFWPLRRRVTSEPHQTWHGDRGPRARSCTSKTFPHTMHSFAVRGRSKFGGTRPTQLKTPLTQ